MNLPYMKIAALLLLASLSLTHGQSDIIGNTPPLPRFMETEEDSGSIEIPVRKQRSGQSGTRPIVELVLGVLDTFHSSSKSDLKRLKARHVHQKDYETTFATTSTTEPPDLRIYATKLAANPKKRFATSRL